MEIYLNRFVKIANTKLQEKTNHDYIVLDCKVFRVRKDIMQSLITYPKKLVYCLRQITIASYYLV